MPKSLTITDEIKAALRKATGDENMEFDNIVVFETVLADTRALNKRGSIFDKGRIARSTLVEMAELLDRGGTTIPLITLHNGQELPVGRVFKAQVYDQADGESELRGLFFVPKSRAQLISDIDVNVLNSVSIGMLSKHLFCSECGFDFRGEDATFMHLFDKTCENGHVMGQDGAHVRVVGLDSWYETSLVGSGAVATAKIVSRAKALMADAQIERLAANGIPAEATVLAATFKDVAPTLSSGESRMELKDLVKDLTEVNVQLSKAHTKIEGLESDVTRLTADVEAKDKQIAHLEGKLKEAGDSAKLTSDLEAARKQLAELTSFLKDQAKAALVATGKDDSNLPDEVEALLATVKESGLKLHQLVASGGKAEEAASGADATEQKRATAAFKIRK